MRPAWLRPRSPALREGWRDAVSVRAGSAGLFLPALRPPFLLSAGACGGAAVPAGPLGGLLALGLAAGLAVRLGGPLLVGRGRHRLGGQDGGLRAGQKVGVKFRRLLRLPSLCGTGPAIPAAAPGAAALLPALAGGALFGFVHDGLLFLVVYLHRLHLPHLDGAGGLRRFGLGGGRFRGGGIPGVAADHRDLFAVQLFDAGQILPLLRGAEADCHAVRPGPGGPPDAVDIGLGHLGQVVVEHMDSSLMSMRGRRCRWPPALWSGRP